MHEIAKAIYTRESTAVEKYDYFVCGVAGALFAYVGQNYTPQKFETIYSFLTPLALIFLTSSFIFGSQRIYLANLGIKLNKQFIKEHEDCIHITQQLNEIAKAKVPSIITDKVSGQVITVEFLTERRTNKLAAKSELERISRSKFKWANRFEHCRDICLLIGFALIIASKAIQPYIK